MPQRRIGSVTLGVSMIAFGVLFFLRTFTKLVSYEFVLKLWPLVLIIFGLEVLIAVGKKKGQTFKFDFVSLLMTALLLGSSACMAALQLLIEQYPNEILFR